MEEIPGPREGFKCCSMCIRHCFETHGDFGRHEAEQSYAAPAFFSRITASHVIGSKFLRIPVLFMEKQNYNVGDKLNLKGPSGFECEATVERYDNGFVLQTGFNQFVKHHKVEAGDSLLFTLTAKSSFLVKVFDKCGSEKTVSETIYATKSNDNLADDESFPVFKRQRKHVRKCRLKSKEFLRENSDDFGVDEASDEDAVDSMLRQKQLREMLAARLKEDSGKHSQSKCIQEDKEQHLDASTPLLSSPNKSDHYEQQEPFFDQPAAILEDCEGASLVSKVLDFGDVGDVAVAKQRAAALRAIKNDRTVQLVIDDATPAYTVFPKEFGSIYLQQLFVILKTGSQQWSTNYLQDVSRLQGGWKKFLAENHLKNGDICVMELEEEQSDQAVFEVQFFRLADFQPDHLESDCGNNVSRSEVAREKSINDAVDVVNMEKRCKSSASNNEEEDIQQVGRSSVMGGKHLSKQSSAVPQDTAPLTQASGSRSIGNLGSTLACSGQKRKQQAMAIKEKEANCLYDAARPLINTLRNPHQFCVMTNSHVNTHHNVYLSKLDLPKVPSTLTLLDSSGGQYTVTWVVSTSSGSRLGAGWKQFVTDHEIEVGDACVFERMSDLVITVHVFHLDDHWDKWNQQQARDLHPTGLHPPVNATVKQEVITSGKITTPPVALRQTSVSASKPGRIKKKAYRPRGDSAI